MDTYCLITKLPWVAMLYFLMSTTKAYACPLTGIQWQMHTILNEVWPLLC
jgi:hypothetical protein